MEISITKTWNGEDTGHPAVNLKLSAGTNDSVHISVDAPYFGDPQAPPGDRGQPFPQLWDYEVVEVFFLNDDDRYVEVELCPHGQHLVLLLNGRRNIVQDKLPMNYTASVDGSRWRGDAQLPVQYLPPNVNRMNSFAIHGSGNNRVYEALYPSNGSFTQPDFHRLEFFKTIDMSFVPGYDPTTTSEVWKKILNN